MIEPQKRSAVMALWGAGNSKRSIARALDLDPKTVRAIIATQGATPPARPRSVPLPPPAVLAELHRRCQGYALRMQELLRAEHGLTVGYSTLTRAIRRLRLRQSDKPQLAAHVPDQPGQEMQHDTSVYCVALGDRAPAKLICSILYLRYSKMRYVAFYRSFNRFRMKCFLHEALSFFGHCARDCIVDNTSLVVVGGAGSDALFAPEMVAFANSYGFRWTAHALRHPNRKAGTERAFWTVETSFLPGRTFRSLEDLNAQALQWATDTYAKRPQSHTGLVPAALFEHELLFLRQLPTHLSPPSQPHRRTTDAYGYVRFGRNFYWVPDVARNTELTIVEYAGRIVIYATANQELISYQLPPEDTQRQVFAPADTPRCSRLPRNLKPGYENQEKLLRSRGALVAEYLDYIHGPHCPLRYKPRFIRQLYEIACSTDEATFLAIIHRALEFHIHSLDALLRIGAQIASGADLPPPSGPSAADSLDYRQRPEYRLGEFCGEHPTDPSLLDLPPQPRTGTRRWSNNCMSSSTP